MKDKPSSRGRTRGRPRAAEVARSQPQTDGLGFVDYVQNSKCHDDAFGVSAPCYRQQKCAKLPGSWGVTTALSLRRLFLLVQFDTDSTQPMHIVFWLSTATF